jgi:lysophospholipase L1-like esterase
MRIGLGIGLGRPGSVAGVAPLSPPTLGLTLSPAAPAVGDLVTITAIAGGNPAPTDLATLALTIGGTAVGLAGAGLSRTFVVRAGTIAASASVTTTEGTASATLSGTIAAAPTVATVSGFGSSTIEGDGASGTAAYALTLIGGAMGAGTIRNKGIAGTVLQNSLASGGTPLASNGRDRFAADLLGANKSDRLYILYGANDLRYTGAPATFNLAGFASDMREVLNGLLLGGYARGEIVIGSPNWYPDTTYSVGSAGFTGSNRTLHEAYVNECLAIATEYGIACADVYGKLRDLGGVALMSADGLHCNDAGHQVIAHAFLTAAQVNARAAVTVGAASSPALQTLSLGWTAVAGAVSYTVEAGLAGSYGFPQTATVTGMTNSFTGLAAGGYVGRIRANFADGSGPWSFWTTPVTVSDSAAPARTVTGQDTFTGKVAGALVEALVPTLGTWVRHASSTGNAAITSDGVALRGPGTTSQFCVATLANQALGAGVFVELDYKVLTNNAQLTSYGVARASTADLTFLAAGYNGSAWRILKYVAGTATVLGTYAFTETVGALPTMRFEVETGIQRLYRNDVLVLTTTEPDSGLGTTGTGLGLRIGAGTTAWTSANGAPFTGIRVGRLGA